MIFMAGIGVIVPLLTTALTQRSEEKKETANALRQLEGMIVIPTGNLLDTVDKWWNNAMSVNTYLMSMIDVSVRVDLVEGNILCWCCYEEHITYNGGSCVCNDLGMSITRC